MRNSRQKSDHVERLRQQLTKDMGRPNMHGGVMSSEEFRAIVEADIGPPPSQLRQGRAAAA